MANNGIICVAFPFCTLEQSQITKLGGKSMNRKWSEGTIMNSWRHSIQRGLQPNATDKCYPLFDLEIQHLLEAHCIEITTFRSVVGNFQFPTNTSFLLIDQNGTLLEKTPSDRAHRGIRTGFSFAEDCAGTNAVALALALKEPVWTLREQNFLSILSRFSLYCVPCTGILSGHYVALVTGSKQPVEWPIALLQQIACRMRSEMQNTHQSIASPIAVSNRQREVISCIAHGMKDVEIAIELHISLNTVRYHKKNLYQLLNADNRVSAVIQALKRRIIDLGQIDECK